MSFCIPMKKIAHFVVTMAAVPVLFPQQAAGQCHAVDFDWTWYCGVCVDPDYEYSWQDVELWDDSLKEDGRSYRDLGFTRQFIEDHSSAVGILQHNNDGKFYCTGTLIDRDLVLTAAHCLLTDPSGVLFDYQRTSQNDVPTMDNKAYFEVAEVIESGWEDHLDYALLRLNPRS